MYKIPNLNTKIKSLERLIHSTFSRTTPPSLQNAKYACCSWRQQRRWYAAIKNASPSATSTPPAASAEAATLVNFDQLISRRRHEAGRSILVQVNSENSFPELHRYCSQYGTIASAHHYAHDEQHYILLEYEASEAAQAAVNSGVHNRDSGPASTATVVSSPFLWFRAGPKTGIVAAPTSSPVLNIVDGTGHTEPKALYEELRQAKDIDTQMRLLHCHTRLNDVGTRLRFLAARQIEQSLHGMFPQAAALPFGSSVNGFGRLGCDLDLILRLDGSSESDGAANAASATSRLVYHVKEPLSNGRSQTQRQMESISDMLQLFLPGVCHVRRILQARVPIIKYRHDHLDLEVDLSMGNLTGVYMSELLYMFGQIDERVMPLIFTVRRWAQSVGLTNPSPGRWISNFSLTCLVIFYLQQLRPVAILPTIDSLMATARRPQDVRTTEDGLNCTFLRDLVTVVQLQQQQPDTKRRPATENDRTTTSTSNTNETTLAELLIGFFEFYAQLSFADRAISLNAGRTVAKPDHAAMHIVNPLEVHLNVSKNVSAEECERFRIEVRNAAWSLDSFGEVADSATSGPAAWGVLSIVRHTNAGGAAGPAAGAAQSVIRPSMFYRPRMVDVSDLFGAGDGSSSSSDGEQKITDDVFDDFDGRTGRSAAAKTPTTTPPFKNAAVRGIVEKIKRKGRSDLQQLENEYKEVRQTTGLPVARLRKR